MRPAAVGEQLGAYAAPDRHVPRVKLEPRPDHPDSHVAEANVEHEKSQRDESPGTPVMEDPTTPRGPVTQRNPLFSAPQPEEEIALD